MIINCISHYVPETIVSNEYFHSNFNIHVDEIFEKTGIRQRRQTSIIENTNTMAIDAVKRALPKLPYSIDRIDLIIGATYTPYDTVGTLAHAVQRHFKIDSAKCFSLDSACSTVMYALEVADCYLSLKKASKVLIVASENNSAYNDHSDKNSGFLWGDGAAAIFVSKTNYSASDFLIIDISTNGLGSVGKNIDAVYLRPNNGGIKMPYGRDVFQFACKYMVQETINILKKNNLSLEQLKFLIPHQANARIIDYVIKDLNIKKSSVLNNIEEFGNTGSASTLIVLSQNIDKIHINDLVVISAFGGGYSSGAVLLKKI